MHEELQHVAKQVSSYHVGLIGLPTYFHQKACLPGQELATVVRVTSSSSLEPTIGELPWKSVMACFSKQLPATELIVPSVDVRAPFLQRMQCVSLIRNLQAETLEETPCKLGYAAHTVHFCKHGA